jgi:hypothetical protein
MSVNDKGNDEGVNDGDHEELGGDEVVRKFPEIVKKMFDKLDRLSIKIFFAKLIKRQQQHIN